MRFVFPLEGGQILPHYFSFRVARKIKCVICEETVSVYYEEDTHHPNPSNQTVPARLKAVTCFTLSASFFIHSHTLAEKEEKKGGSMTNRQKQ